MSPDRTPPKNDSDRSGSPEVSVVVPFLNASRFLEETIESVFAQSYSEWELLLCDDGSTDGSTDIARRCALRHAGKVFYIEHAGHANLGLSATRNLGLRQARGKFLALLDADDVWVPEKLREQVQLLDAYPEAGMLYGDTLHWYSWTGDPRDATRDYRQPLGVPLNTLSTPPAILIRYLRGTAAVACTCSVLARREIVERVGGFEESFQALYEDQVFYAKMLLTAPVYVADRMWDKYRIHPESMCAVAERAHELGRAHLQYLDWLERYLNERGLARGPLWRALQAERWRSRHPRVTRLHRGLRRRISAAIPQSVRRRFWQ
jgi:glycosyltransferase involved in cell wall biosynthesis